MEIFEFAMKMELDGKGHYEKLAAQTEHVGLKNIFLTLAAEEQRHYDILSTIRAGEMGEVYESPVLAQAQNIFSELTADKKAVAGLKKDLEGYQYAMKIEADSVRLYENAATGESSPDNVQLFLRLANEEKKHYNIMENLYDHVLRPEYFLEWREFSNLREL